ncbi:MFS transporter [Pseudonocardia endophytica]|uniref:EmrB/QacA subfamily drug resistance transporter n=1 Tax=Pseudonocardia endophytica TaxID=401976 RepID=A0A4V2PIF2_PSEEN|nr:MFS transporter [Pseudonocardia endophytica]TCK24356.1 EmrB/QacA subfamily drug resistance transporter [Pseudonocardia endophytica]
MHDLDRRGRLRVLAVCCCSLFVVGLDNTIVNLALPAIATDLHAGYTGLQWTVDAYTLVLAALLMLAGSVADRIGRRRVFRTGLLLFGLGSLLCSVATGTGTLIAARVLQAVGGSMLNPVAMSIITNTFTERRERASAIGVWGAVIGLSMALGPLLGGVLVATAGWRAIFWINVPVVVAAFLAAARFVPESRAERPRRIDPLGQVLVALVLAGVTFAIIESPAHGPTSPLILGVVAVALASGAGYAVHARRHPEPLIDLRFFASAPFTGATVVAVAAFASMGGFLFLSALYLQQVRGWSALHAGLLTLPMAAMTAVLPPVSGRLVGSRGTRLPLLIGGTGIAAAGALFTGLGPATPVWYLVVSFAVFGVGFGFVNAPITTSAVSGMPDSRAGVAAAVASTSRQVGATLGVAVLGTIATAGAGGGVSLTDAALPSWLVMLGCGLLIVVLGAATTGRWARATAERVRLVDDPVVLPTR